MGSACVTVDHWRESCVQFVICLNGALIRGQDFAEKEGLTVKIVCFGDSVTRGISFFRGRLRIQRQNYPYFLQERLDGEGRDIQVVNKGVWNDTSTHLLQRLKADVLDLDPDLVLIEIGGNDCNFRWDEVAASPHDVHEPIVPLREYLENVTRLVKEIDGRGTLPVLLTLLPLDPVRYYRHLVRFYGDKLGHWIGLCGGIEHWHGMYNRFLRRLISDLNISWIDLRNRFKRKGDLQELLSDDGVHPLPTGYRAMAECILEGLIELGLAKPARG